MILSCRGLWDGDRIRENRRFRARLRLTGPFWGIQLQDHCEFSVIAPPLGARKEFASKQSEGPSREQAAPARREPVSNKSLAVGALRGTGFLSGRGMISALGMEVGTAKPRGLWA